MPCSQWTELFPGMRTVSFDINNIVKNVNRTGDKNKAGNDDQGQAELIPLLGKEDPRQADEVLDPVRWAQEAEPGRQ